MIKLKTSLHSIDKKENLGDIVVELSEMNYDKILEQVLPFIMEEGYEKLALKNRGSENKLMMQLLKILYQNKKVSIDAVSAALAMFPVNLKEVLLKTILTEVNLEEPACKYMIPYGLLISKITVVEDTINGDNV